MSPDLRVDIDVEPIANASVACLQKQALRQLAIMLDVDSADDAAQMVYDVDFKVIVDGYVKFAEGDIIGTYPLNRASFTASIVVNGSKGTSYNGGLF